MSACRCTAYETCFPCRDREAHRDSVSVPWDECPWCRGSLSQRVSPRVSPPPAEAPDVEPATDEMLTAWERNLPAYTASGRREVPAHYLAEAIARIRQAEAAWARDRLTLQERVRREQAEATRLREQFERMQAADVGAFW